MAIPDATLLIGGLDVLTAATISQYPEVHFRLQTFRHQNNVDHVPTQDKAMSLGQMLQAELQILEHAVPNKKSKLARLQDKMGRQRFQATDGEKPGNKGTSKGTPKGSGLKRVEEEKPLGNEQAKQLSAATTLIKQMQAKALSERPSMYRLQGEGKNTGLIDSGASACLRQIKGNEPKGLARQTVDLAQGSVELFATPCGTLVCEEPVET